MKGDFLNILAPKKKEKKEKKRHSLFIKFSIKDNGITPSLIQKYVNKKNDKQIREIKYR